jgi:hypothetical protein
MRQYWFALAAASMLNIMCHGSCVACQVAELAAAGAGRDGPVHWNGSMCTWRQLLIASMPGLLC